MSIRLGTTKTCLVTGGAGFLGSHLCERLLARRPRGALRRQLLHRHASDNIAHLLGQPALRAAAPRRHLPALRRGGRDLQPRLPGLARSTTSSTRCRPPRPACTARSTCWAWPSGCKAQDPPGLHQRGLRRPAGASAARGLLGQRQPDRPALLLRRGQALRRDAVLRLPPPAQAATSRSRASSTPTARACTPTTAAWSPTSSCRRCRASPSRSTATASRRARSATSTT